MKYIGYHHTHTNIVVFCMCIEMSFSLKIKISPKINVYICIEDKRIMATHIASHFNFIEKLVKTKPRKTCSSIVLLTQFLIHHMNVFK